MDLAFTETEAKKIWDDKAFLFYIEGCVKVVTTIITSPIDSAYEYLAVRPTMIVFSDRVIRLCYAMSNALGEYVSLNIQPIKAE